jgi:predicted DNA-binding transcriptional regulator YafY
MRSQRQIACLQLLQGERRLTARYLADELAVSIRTIYRDVEALCEAGVPIHMERGPLGGIVLADGYRRALAQFTNEELQALFAVGPGPLTDLGIGSHRTALAKLAGALPDRQRQQATTMRDRLLLDHNRWGRADQPTDLLRRLRSAVDDQRCVRLDYRDRGGAVTERRVDPLGLVAKAGIWYLIAAESDKGYRTFRADRIIGVEPLAQSFTRPVGFDLESYWASSVASIERRSPSPYNVVLRVRADAPHALHPYWESTIIARDDEAITVQIGFSSREVAVAEVVTFSHVVDIISPGDMIAAVIAYAQSIVDKYRAMAPSVATTS